MLLRIVLLIILSTAVASAQPWLDRVRVDVDTLTSSTMRGRGYQQEGHLRAAEFIRDRFRQLGLDSLNGSYFQPFDIEVQEVTATPRLEINGKPLRFGFDFLPVVNGASGEGEDLRTIARPDHGLVIPPKGINNYDGISVLDGVSIISPGAPEQLTADTSIDRFFFSDDAKAYVATLAGAKVILFTTERLVHGDIGEQWDIPAFRVRSEALPETIESVSFSIRTGTRQVQTNNVIARLKGTRSPDSTIILCAHYDHLGAVDDSLYFPGANDNASGTALLLEMARVLKERPLPYSVLFMAFSGEELGLRGSRYFVSQPLADLRACRFLLNFDMTASGNDGIMAVGGIDFPEEYALLQAVNDSLNLGELRKRANAPNSDHFFFVRQGVRGFYIYPYTGYQPYHHINDRPATLEWNVFEKIYRLTEAFLRRL